MKVLWVIGTPRNCINEIFEWPLSNNVSGGWIDNALHQIDSNSDISIDYVCCSKKAKANELLRASKGNSKAFAIHLPKISFGVQGNKSTIALLKGVINESKPDIIHIWGSESGLAYDVSVANADKIPTIIFTQGLIGIHSLYYCGQLRRFSSIFLGFNGTKQCLISKMKQKYYQKQMVLEREIALKSYGVLTDNQYTADYYHLLNPNIKIIDYPLPVNRVFCESKWTNNVATPHTIFTVFGRDLNKGLPTLIMALNIVKQVYPDVKLNIPGPCRLKNSWNVPNRKLNACEIWMKKCTKKNNLRNNIEFAGYLTPEQMKDNMLKSSIFVNPSCMEVHAGSVREAMYLGMPTISSVCGSVLEFMINGENSLLYRYEEISTLASKIIYLFDHPEFAESIAKNAYTSIRAKYPTDVSVNIGKIYSDMLNDLKKEAK